MFLRRYPRLPPRRLRRRGPRPGLRGHLRRGVVRRRPAHARVRPPDGGGRRARRHRPARAPRESSAPVLAGAVAGHRRSRSPSPPSFRGLLFGVGSSDPLVLGGVVVVLGAVARRERAPSRRSGRRAWTPEWRCGPSDGGAPSSQPRASVPDPEPTRRRTSGRGATFAPAVTLGGVALLLLLAPRRCSCRRAAPRACIRPSRSPQSDRGNLREPRVSDRRAMVDPLPPELPGGVAGSIRGRHDRADQGRRGSPPSLECWRTEPPNRLSFRAARRLTACPLRGFIVSRTAAPRTARDPDETPRSPPVPIPIPVRTGARAPARGRTPGSVRLQRLF